MKLSHKAIEALTEHRAIRLDVAIALGFSEVWINKLIAANKDNGPLTTAKALQVLIKETRLEADDLLSEEVKAA